MSPKRIINLSDTPGSGGEVLSLREHLISAAERVVRRKGFARITVREIASEAGVADGTLYNHFRDKEELLVEAILRHLSVIEDMFRELSKQAGAGTVAGNLESLATAVLDFEWETVPLLSSLHTEPVLLKRLHSKFHSEKIGPHGARREVSNYLREEQRLGRVDRNVDPDAVAMLLVGTLHDLLFARHMLGDNAGGAAASLVPKLVETLMHGIDPREEQV